jgi:integrase
MPRKPKIPKYSLHKPSGRARVIIDGRHIWLGKYGSDESVERYNRLVAEIAATPTGLSPSLPPKSLEPITVVEVLAAYLKHAEGYYVKNGRPTVQVEVTKAAIRQALKLYGRSPAIEFGPAALKRVRQQMVGSGICRNEVNRRVQIVRRAFKWAVSEEMLPVSVYQALATVEGLRKGRTDAPDHPPVGAVSDDVVDATVPFMPPLVADMVRLQRLTGMRPGEVTSLRPGDVDRSDTVWVYSPATHKNEHHGTIRTIFLGPKAQEILAPYLLRAADAYCFSPAESVRQQQKAAHAARKTPLSCGNRPGTNRKRRPKRKPRDRYDKNAYANVIRRAIKKANEKRQKEEKAPLPRWTPNMLRHSAATEIRRRFDLEAVQSILGHTSMNTSEIYAEKNLDLAREIARKIG